MKPAIGLVVLVAVIALSWWLADNRPGARADRILNDALPVEALETTYDPVRAGEETPEGYRQLLGRDQIPPVYNPRFTSASNAEWADDSLVIGISRDGEAKAYPVSFLNYREMVIDWIGDTPILVTW